MKILRFATFAFMTAVVGASALPVHAQVADPESVVRQYYDARSRGDLDGAMRLVAPDATYTTGPCAPTCVGLADIQKREVGPAMANGGQYTAVDLNVSGDTVMLQLEVRNKISKQIGIDRFLNTISAQVRDGKIVAYKAASLPTDPQTATYLAYTRAQAAGAQPLGDAKYTVSAEWLAQHVSNPAIVLVDVRPPDLYNAGHIQGAVNLPWTLLAQPSTDDAAIPGWEQDIVARLGSVGITASDAVVSYDDSGNLFAARLWWVLEYFGHQNVAVLDGGLPAWTQFGRELTVQPTTRPVTLYMGSAHPQALATWQYVLDRIDDPDVQILDVRPVAAYTGEAAGTDLHSGHIPGALNSDWNTLVQSEPPRTYKTVDDLRAQFRAIGLDPNKQIIVYCVTGVASSDALVALEMVGYPRVRLYSASWAEWGNREDLPFVTGADPG